MAELSYSISTTYGNLGDVLPADAQDFEEAALHACEGDPRIGKYQGNGEHCENYCVSTSWLLILVRRKKSSPVVSHGAREVGTKKGFAKPSRRSEVLTTPSAFPRTGGMTSA